MNESSNATGVSKSGGRIDRMISLSLPKRCAADCVWANNPAGANRAAAAAIARCERRSLREIIRRLYSAHQYPLARRLVIGAAASSITPDVDGDRRQSRQTSTATVH